MRQDGKTSREVADSIGSYFRGRPQSVVVPRSVDAGKTHRDQGDVPFRSFKTEWLPTVEYTSAQEAHSEISHYLMHRLQLDTAALSRYHAVRRRRQAATRDSEWRLWSRAKGSLRPTPATQASGI